jgi:hypothetical protein
MIRLATLAILPLLASCMTATAINCDNAAVVRATAQMTIDAVDYACPIPGQSQLNETAENSQS